MTISEPLVVGYVFGALVLIVSFAATILKLSKPLQDLNINIIKLTTVVSYITKEQDSIKHRVETHGQELDRNKEMLIKHEERLKQLEEVFHEYKQI